MLQFNGNLTLASGGTAGLLSFSGSGSTTYAGNIAAGSISGLAASGTGTLTLSGNNAFAGGVALNSGILNINSATALGTGTFTIAGGAIDNTNGGVTLTANNPVVLNASFAYNGTGFRQSRERRGHAERTTRLLPPTGLQP